LIFNLKFLTVTRCSWALSSGDYVIHKWCYLQAATKTFCRVRH